MKGFTRSALTATLLSTSSLAFASSCPDILQGKQRLLNSTEEIELCDAFKGKTLLVVNTASQCGFTPQFEQLEQLHQTYKDQNFAVVGFPSNDFRQDRGSEEKTAKICYLDYGVTFPMMREPLFLARMQTQYSPRSVLKRALLRNGTSTSS